MSSFTEASERAEKMSGEGEKLVEKDQSRGFLLHSQKKQDERNQKTF